jgi:hypothetical protein
MNARAPRHRLGRVVFVAAMLATFARPAIAVAEPPSTSKIVLADAQPAPALRKGVVVVGVGDGAADATWPVAIAIYGDASLRPKIEDRDARALAGESVDAKAPAPTTELAALRAKITGDDPASLAMLSDVARRAGARAVVVVFPAHDEKSTTQARLFDAADAHLEPTKFEADATRPSAPWGALVDAMHARYAPKTTTTPLVLTPAPAEDKTEKKDSGSFLSSAWFWGALGAAALMGGVVYALTRDNGQGTPAPVRIEWGK